MRDQAAEMMELERQFRAGKKRAVLDAVYVCVCSRPQKAVPRWASQALSRAMYAIATAKAVSWDDVFDPPYPPGTKIEAVRRQRALQWKVFTRVEELRRRKPKPRNILQIVADENNISYASAKRYSEHVRNIWFRKPAR